MRNYWLEINGLAWPGLETREMKVNESILIETMRTAYYTRLLEVLGETDVKDKKGNVVIEPGLKVRHKESQYEYTVDSVDENPQSGEITVTLKSPETPRFEPTPQNAVLGEESPVTASHPDDEPEASYDVNDEDEIFIVDEKEFEKDYEVN